MFQDVSGCIKGLFGLWRTTVQGRLRGQHHIHYLIRYLSVLFYYCVARPYAQGKSLCLIYISFTCSLGRPNTFSAVGTVLSSVPFLAESYSKIFVKDTHSLRVFTKGIH